MGKKNEIPLLKAVQSLNTKNNTINILGWGATPYVITGFGTVMRKVLSNLFKLYPGKYNVNMVGINHGGDFYEEAEITGGNQNGRLRMWPAMPPGTDRRHLYGHFKFLDLIDRLDLSSIDLVFLFEDPFWVGGPIPGTNPPDIYIDTIKKKLTNRGFGHLPVVSYFPIDGIPKKEWIVNIAKADFPITYLTFGVKSCVDLVPELQNKLSIIPHGVDPKEFFPINEQEKRIFRRAMFGDEFVDKFMFLNVNRNQLRKLIPSTLIAFKEFQNLTNSAGFIYLNMRPVDVGWNLFECCKAIGLQIGIDVLFPPNFNVQKGLTLEELNKVFSCADVLLSTATGGGWELAITQAFAAKTAVIAPANTSHIELLGDQSSEDLRGLLYKCGSNLAQKIIFPQDNEVIRPLPDLDDMLSKMMLIYTNSDLKFKLENNAYTWALNNLSWERDVVPKFDAIFSAAKELKLSRTKG